MDGNEVEIDPAALAAEADAALAGAGEQSPASGEPAATSTIDVDELRRAEDFARRAEPVVAKILGGLAAVVAPNWTIAADQGKGLAQSVSFALALWFPHEIPPKYAALLMVGVSLYGIADANRDSQTGQLKPLRAKAARTDGATVET